MRLVLGCDSHARCSSTVLQVLSRRFDSSLDFTPTYCGRSARKASHRSSWSLSSTRRRRKAQSAITPCDAIIATVNAGSTKTYRSDTVRSWIPLASIAYCLDLPVLFFELSLHIEIKLSLTLDALLFHISDDAFVHCLAAQMEG